MIYNTLGPITAAHAEMLVEPFTGPQEIYRRHTLKEELFFLP